MQPYNYAMPSRHSYNYSNSLRTLSSSVSAQNTPFLSLPRPTPTRPVHGCICPCTCGTAHPATTPKTTPHMQGLSPKPTHKRVQSFGTNGSGKENSQPNALHISQPEVKKWKYMPQRTLEQKIANFFTLLKTVDWSLTECIYYLFTHVDSKRDPIWWSQQHGAAVQTFLAGHMKYAPMDIIHSWLHSKNRRLDCDLDLMFLLDTAYTEIKPVRPCLTSFATQMVLKKQVHKAKEAVHPTGGLWAIVSCKSSLKQAEWADHSCARCCCNIPGSAVADMALSHSHSHCETSHLTRYHLRKEK